MIETLFQIKGKVEAHMSAPLLQERVKLDNQVLIDYITETLGGVIGEDYVEPTGDGRIVIVEEAP